MKNLTTRKLVESAILIAIIPTIVVYSMFSNQIVDGLTTGAVKG